MSSFNNCSSHRMVYDEQSSDVLQMLLVEREKIISFFIFHLNLENGHPENGNVYLSGIKQSNTIHKILNTQRQKYPTNHETRHLH